MATRIEVPFFDKTFVVKTTAKNDGKNNPGLIFEIEESDDVVDIGTLQRGPGSNISINLNYVAILDILREGVYTLYVEENRGA
jgi:hypothetical protein